MGAFIRKHALRRLCIQLPQVFNKCVLLSVAIGHNEFLYNAPNNIFWHKALKIIKKKKTKQLHLYLIKNNK